jgi:preprotein translocase subunit YajC
MHNLFLSTGGEAEAVGGGLFSILGTLPMIAIFVFFAYFLLYRPQKKQERAINEMRSSLRVGDEIATNGGILGKIIQIKDDFIIIETGNAKTKMKIAKWGVRSVEHREEDDEEDEDGDEE